jgi:hypothetical protein
MPHKGGYPFEDIQLGTPMKRDAGQAYLPIEDVKDIKDYVPHPFDAHPVHRYADMPEKELLPEHHEAINAGLQGWSDSDQHKKWLADQKAKHAASPEAYKARGTVKPEHPFEGVPLQEMPHHKDQAAPTGEATEQPEQAALATEKTTSDTSKPPEGLDPSIAKHWNSFPDNTRAEIIKDFSKRKR